MYREFEDGLHEGIILGDGGYPLKGLLMTPVLNPISRAEERYNRSHRATRTVIERCNGILKRRFHYLHGELYVCHLKEPIVSLQPVSSSIIAQLITNIQQMKTKSLLRKAMRMPITTQPYPGYNPGNSCT